MFLAYFLGSEMEYFNDGFSSEDMINFLRRIFRFENAVFSAREIGFFCVFLGPETLRK